MKRFGFGSNMAVKAAAVLFAASVSFASGYSFPPNGSYYTPSDLGGIVNDVVTHKNDTVSRANDMLGDLRSYEDSASFFDDNPEAVTQTISKPEKLTKNDSPQTTAPTGIGGGTVNPMEYRSTMDQIRMFRREIDYVKMLENDLQNRCDLISRYMVVYNLLRDELLRVHAGAKAAYAAKLQEIAYRAVLDTAKSTIETAANNWRNLLMAEISNERSKTEAELQKLLDRDISDWKSIECYTTCDCPPPEEDSDSGTSN